MTKRTSKRKTASDADAKNNSIKSDDNPAGNAAQNAPAKAASLPPSYWSIVGGTFSSLLAGTKSALLFAPILLILVVLYVKITEENPPFIFEPLAVPPTLVQRGLTPEIAAARLRDVLSQLSLKSSATGNERAPTSDEVQRVRTKQGAKNESPKAFQAQEAPLFVARGKNKDIADDIVIPTIGVSISSIAATMRGVYERFVPVGRQQKIVSAEILNTGNNLYSLRIRLNGALVYQSQKAVTINDPEQIDAMLFSQAALPLLERLVPHVALQIEIEKKNVSYADKLKKAQQVLRYMPKGDDSAPWIYNQIGLIFQQLKRNDEARAAYNEALRINPGFANAHHNLAVLYFSENKYRESLSSARKAIAFSPNMEIAYTQKASTLRMLHYAASEAKTISSSQWIALFPWLSSFLEVPYLEEAIQAYRHAIRITPSRGENYRSLAIVLEDLERREEAIGVLKRALVNDRYDHATYNDLGVSLSMLDRDDAALEAYCESLELKPDFHLARRNLQLLGRSCR